MLTVLTHPFPTRPSSDLDSRRRDAIHITSPAAEFGRIECLRHQWLGGYLLMPRVPVVTGNSVRLAPRPVAAVQPVQLDNAIAEGVQHFGAQLGARSEEHTSELQSLMRISYAFFCLKQKIQN